MDGAGAGRGGRFTAAAGASVLLALAACSSPPAVSPPPAADPDSPAAAYLRTSPWGEGDQALLEGVARLADGCLVVEGTDGARTVPVFPTDFAWDESERTLTGRGHVVVVDEPVTLGGGATSSAEIVEHLPEGCTTEELFVVHSMEDG